MTNIIYIKKFIKNIKNESKETAVLISISGFND
jgi:hypothetical protein